MTFGHATPPIYDGELLTAMPSELVSHVPAHWFTSWATQVHVGMAPHSVGSAEQL
jgi:hypothetical protein